MTEMVSLALSELPSIWLISNRACASWLAAAMRLSDSKEVRGSSLLRSSAEASGRTSTLGAALSCWKPAAGSGAAPDFDFGVERLQAFFLLRVGEAFEFDKTLIENLDNVRIELNAGLAS